LVAQSSAAPTCSWFLQLNSRRNPVIGRDHPLLEIVQSAEPNPKTSFLRRKVALMSVVKRKIAPINKHHCAAGSAAEKEAVV
jgi:ribosomal protein S24E